LKIVPKTKGDRLQGSGDRSAPASEVFVGGSTRLFTDSEQEGVKKMLWKLWWGRPC